MMQQSFAAFRNLYLEAGASTVPPATIVSRTNSDPTMVSGNNVVVSALVHNAQSLKSSGTALTITVQGSISNDQWKPVFTLTATAAEVLKPGYLDDITNGADWLYPWLRVEVALADPASGSPASILLDVTVGMSDQG